MEEAIDNDTRGWILSIISGIACVVGASIICVDVLVRCIPSQRNFRIQDSNVFLAASLSLSFGVMIFSALFSMLPSSKRYLIGSGISGTNAAWTLLGFFTAGFVGIQIVSRFLHHHIPSHVVDCDHNHKEASHDHDHYHSRRQSSVNHRSRRQSNHTPVVPNGNASETTPLFPADCQTRHKIVIPRRSASQVGYDGSRSRQASEGPGRRTSMKEVPARLMSYLAEQIKDQNSNCDEGGPCFGYSDPCGQECFKYIAVRSPAARTPSNSRANTFPRTATNSFRQPLAHPTLENDLDAASPEGTTAMTGPSPESEGDYYESESELGSTETQHHHHVPENAFMNIGLQTSIAIALHKIPEGFITYATNHANPSLGFSVFMALFVHNITEGFALVLPLYLALHSRAWAMVWASLLGGLTQPLGAGIAAIWFKVAGREGLTPGTRVYGCMFAATAGIMTSVALQLFVEGLSLNHNKNSCIAFAFIGMAIMGTSNALVSM